MVNFFFCVKKYSGFGDQRETLTVFVLLFPENTVTASKCLVR